MKEIKLTIGMVIEHWSGGLLKIESLESYMGHEWISCLWYTGNNKWSKTSIGVTTSHIKRVIPRLEALVAFGEVYGS